MDNEEDGNTRGKGITTVPDGTMKRERKMEDGTLKMVDNVERGGYKRTWDEPDILGHNIRNERGTGTT